MPESAPLIAVDHVSKTVTDSSGTLDILRDIDFTLGSHETLAIVGASGSGKSTLLSIMAGLDTPSSGTVRLAGQDLFALDEDGRAQLRGHKMGFVFQSFQLMPHLTALENAMLPLELAGRRDARARATEMLQRVGLGQRLQHTPRLLSGGEQQRVALARALMSGPRLLLLDEPFSALDTDLRLHLRGEFARHIAEAGMGCVLVTHDEAEARAMGQRGYRLVNGQLQLLWG